MDPEDNDEGLEKEPPEELLRDCDPLPFPSDGDSLQESPPDEFSELKRRTRAKLSSRRFSRRRKEDAKMQAMLSTQHSEELSHLKALSALLQDGASDSPSELRDQLGVLLRKANHSATNLHRLYEQVYSHTLRDGLEHETRPDHLSHLKPVPLDSTKSAQFRLALFNARFLRRVLSDPERDGHPEFAMRTFAGWRVVELKRRGSRLCALATRKIFGVSRDTLSRSVWDNADDKHRRVSTATRYASFAATTAKSHDLQGSSCEFYSHEVHEYPEPFLCRSFMSIHGIDHTDRGFWYVKQSLNGLPTRSSHVNGSETLSTVIQAGTSDDGRAFVTVDLVILYDTNGICHLERLMSEEPPLCCTLVEQWERNHLSPGVQSVDERTAAS